jgi:large subunit ribosomal protein L4
MKVAVYNQKGESKGEVTLNKDIFEVEVNEGLIHEALILQQANLRNPIAHTKTRGEVRGGGRKPHPQKGTGRARFGSIRTPIHRGGGIVFGPRNTRNFTKMMPKKQRRKALFCALSSKAADKQIIVLEGFDNKEIKTKDFAEMIKNLPIERNALFVLPEGNEVFQKSSRNVANAKTILANYLNIRDLLKYRSLVILKDSLGKIEETFLAGKEATASKKEATAPKKETTKTTKKDA